MPSTSLIVELEDGVRNGSPKKRVDALRRLTNVATPSRVKKLSPSSGFGHRAQKRRIMLAIVGGIVVVITLTVISRMNSQGSSQAIRPTEVIRIGAAKSDSTIRADAIKPSRDAVNVPPPQGTIKRMDAISKAFSKR